MGRIMWDLCPVCRHLSGKSVSIGHWKSMVMKGYKVMLTHEQSYQLRGRDRHVLVLLGADITVLVLLGYELWRKQSRHTEDLASDWHRRGLIAIEVDNRVGDIASGRCTSNDWTLWDGSRLVDFLSVRCYLLSIKIALVSYLLETSFTSESRGNESYVPIAKHQVHHGLLWEWMLRSLAIIDTGNQSVVS